MRILENISRVLNRQQLTLSVAESVTAGYIQFLCSSAPEATSFFQGGITVYNWAQKTMHLGVEPVYALKRNGVARDISATMARNCCHLFNSRLGLGITGFADAASSPEGEAYAFLSVWLAGEEILSEKLYSGAPAFAEAQEDFAHQTLDALSRALIIREK